MPVTGLEIVAICSLIAGALSAFNSTDARRKARKDRRAQAQTKGHGKYNEPEEDDADLGPGDISWRAESRDRARGRGVYREESRSRSRSRLTGRSRSRSMPRPGSRSVHVYNESRSSFGPLNRVDTQGWTRESHDDTRGGISSRRSYANSRTSLGRYQLKSRYREHSQSRSRSRSRHKSSGRRSDSKIKPQDGIGLALLGAAVVGIARFNSNRRDEHAERRREEFDGYQDSDRWGGRDW